VRPAPPRIVSDRLTAVARTTPTEIGTSMLVRPARSAPSAERGVFKTTDGGKSWRKVLYRDDKTGAIDLSMDKYCSATAQFRPTTDITYSFDLL